MNEKRSENLFLTSIFSHQKHKSLAMSSGTSEEKIDYILFTFVQVDKESLAWLFEKNKQRARSILYKENNDTDSTDGIFDFLSQISNSVQEGFDELLGGDSGKKRFVKAMSKIFTLLFKTRVDTAEKIKRIIKIAIETTLKIWQEPRQQEGDYLW